MCPRRRSGDDPMRRDVVEHTPDGYEPPLNTQEFLTRKEDGETFFRRAELSGGELTKADLQGLDLCGANLENAELWGARLDGTILWSANLRFAHLADASFQTAELWGADLTGATLDKAKFGGAQLWEVDFSGTQCWGTDFSNTDLLEADFCGADLTNADLSGAKVTKVTYDRKCKCRGVRIDTASGDPLFKRFVQDQDYIEAYADRHSVIAFVWWLMADYGQSLLRFALWSVLIAVSFGLAMFWFPEWFACNEDKVVTPFTYFYYSIVTFTTLGFGDVVPISWHGEVLVTVEVILGYIMLGGLISILAQKLARRS